MAKAPTTSSDTPSLKDYPEIKDIKSDLQSLKANVVGLGQHLKEDSSSHVQALEGMAKERISDLESASRQQMKKIEQLVKKNPTQSLAIAFATGLLASALFGRKG